MYFMLKKYNRLFLMALFSMVIVGQGVSQDGKKLFKSRCAACHNMKQKLVGPALKGVVKKWEDAGEGDLLKEWIKDPTALKESGKSKMAEAIWDFSPASMTPNPDLKDAEIDAIISYMKKWAPPVPKKKVAKATKVAVTPVVKDNPTTNKIVTILLLFLLALILIAMLAVVKALGNLMKKSQRLNKAATVLVLLGLGLLYPSAGQAQSSTFLPWLDHITKVDIYILIGVIVLLLGVLLYLKSLLDRMTKEVYGSKAAAIKESSIIHALTDAVSIDEEESILMDHDYDGIRELDNSLPPWWLWLFYTTIIFGVVYIFNYHILKTSDLQIEEYEKSMAIADAQVAAYVKEHVPQINMDDLTALTDEKSLSAGKSIFEKKGNCFTCHKKDGGGLIGPNLTDDSWIYGNDIKTIFHTIKDGTDKGMPPMGGASLSPVEIQQVASYILTLKPAEGGKAPEGKKM